MVEMTVKRKRSEVKRRLKTGKQRWCNLYCNSYTIRDIEKEESVKMRRVWFHFAAHSGHTKRLRAGIKRPPKQKLKGSPGSCPVAAYCTVAPPTELLQRGPMELCGWGLVRRWPEEGGAPRGWHP